MAEVSDDTNAILAKVHGKKGAPNPKPLRIPRGRKKDKKPEPLKGDALAQAMRKRGAIKYTPKKKG